MNRSRIASTLALAVALGAAAQANAGAQCPPMPQHSTVPTHLALVGRVGETPDRALGEILVVVKDLTGNPYPYASVVLDFSGAGDVRLSGQSLDPAVQTDCASRSWRAFSNAAGEVRFTVLGGSTGAASSGTSRIHIYADGVLFGTIPVAAYDLDGNGGLSSADLAQWMTDYGSGAMRERSDYDGNGRLDSSDLAAWMTAYSLGGSAESAPSSCP